MFYSSSAPSVNARLAASGGVRGLRHRAAWHYPLHWLCGDLGDEVVVAVVVQECDLLEYYDGGDQQVEEPDRTRVSVAPRRAPDIESAIPRGPGCHDR